MNADNRRSMDSPENPDYVNPDHRLLDALVRNLRPRQTCAHCGAFIRRPPMDGSTWTCSRCRTEFQNPHER